ncbi:hypothetical protein DCAR_0205273 [Daucus carota subsp. sativus]|uniref:Uncharacterized protein n=1 Tax=Daucus carota subsp. sativus TaxID=79200 RepID=A0A175YA20_DAUCS|nr:hypothetical protein DCAR_0205273 [Daucus carota subsp. sativus]
MEFVRFLVLMITSLVLLLHNSCALVVHHQGRKLKGNSPMASQENLAPAKMVCRMHLYPDIVICDCCIHSRYNVCHHKCLQGLIHRDS